MFVGVYIAMYSHSVFSGSISLGTFLATIGIMKDISSEFAEVRITGWFGYTVYMYSLEVESLYFVMPFKERRVFAILSSAHGSHARIFSEITRASAQKR